MMDINDDPWQPWSTAPKGQWIFARERNRLSIVEAIFRRGEWHFFYRDGDHITPELWLHTGPGTATYEWMVKP